MTPESTLAPVELSAMAIGKLKRRAELKLQIKEAEAVIAKIEDDILTELAGNPYGAVNGVPIVSVKSQDRRSFSQPLAQSTLTPELFNSLFVTTTTKPIFKVLDGCVK
jgi:hypothetical protein